MTKKEMFEEVVKVATETGRDDIVEFCNKEIELLNKRYSKERKVSEKRLAERAELAEAIIKVVEESTNPMRTMEIATAVGISPQKATAVLKDLVSDGKLMVDEVKKVKVYAVAA